MCKYVYVSMCERERERATNGRLLCYTNWNVCLCSSLKKMNRLMRLLRRSMIEVI